MTTATETWLRQLQKCVDDGQECGNTLELLSSSLSFDMSDPIVLCKGRKVNYGFMFAEAAYIIQGHSNVSYLEQHISKFGNYSDLYPLQQGSYGPPFVEQVRYVVETLKADDKTRQAVMTIWRPNPRQSKDIPCTMGLQFLIRGNRLHTIATMRSSDIFTGLIYDMFCFTAMTAAVRGFLGFDYSDIKLGTCWINAGSSHLYTKDFDRIKKIDEEMHPYALRAWPHSYEEVVDMIESMANMEMFK